MFTNQTEKTNSETIKTQTKAAKYCGITRWVLDRIEKKHPELNFKDPTTGEYDLAMLDAIRASKNPQYLDAIQSECILMVSKIKDPIKLQTIKTVIAQLQKINTQSQRLIQDANEQQN